MNPASIHEALKTAGLTSVRSVRIENGIASCVLNDTASQADRDIVELFMDRVRSEAVMILDGGRPLQDREILRVQGSQGREIVVQITSPTRSDLFAETVDLVPSTGLAPLDHTTGNVDRSGRFTFNITPTTLKGSFELAVCVGPFEPRRIKVVIS